MNLVIVSSKESFFENPFPDVNILGHVSRVERKNMTRQIHNIILFIRDYILSGYDIDRISRIGWTLIVMDKGILYMIVDLDHPKMTNFSRNLKIDSMV